MVQVVDPVTESGATVFFSGQTLVVACRGSANPKNFGTNLKFKLVEATRLSQTSIPKDAGFQEASVGLWRRLGPHLLELLEEQPPKEVVFTGHSLGAATALLCAVHYSASVKGGNEYSSPNVISFGGPKLCNGVLARHVRNTSLEGSNILHLVHTKDPVLVNNQKLWNRLGFENVGVELQCDPKSPIVFTSNEAKKKKSLFGNLAWNIVDHCNYMGVFVGPRL